MNCEPWPKQGHNNNMFFCIYNLNDKQHKRYKSFCKMETYEVPASVIRQRYKRQVKLLHCFYLREWKNPNSSKAHRIMSRRCELHLFIISHIHVSTVVIFQQVLKVTFSWQVLLLSCLYSDICFYRIVNIPVDRCDGAIQLPGFSFKHFSQPGQCYNLVCSNLSSN